MTSFSANFGDRPTEEKNGVYIFRIKGSIYHQIGALVRVNERPKYLQLYIYDTQNEIENRLQINPTLDRNVLQSLHNMLDRVNPFV